MRWLLMRWWSGGGSQLTLPSGRDVLGLFVTADEPLRQCPVPRKGPVLPPAHVYADVYSGHE
jgi:hypothetical protein